MKLKLPKRFPTLAILIFLLCIAYFGWKNIQISKAYALTWKGRDLIYEGKSAEAIPWLIEASHTDPSLYQPHQYLGYAYYNTKQFKQSIFEFESAVSRGRTTASIYFSLGNAYKEINDIDNAKVY